MADIIEQIRRELVNNADEATEERNKVLRKK